MNFKNFINESHRKDIAELQSDSVITVFHGTDSDTAYDFCLNGIDGKKQQKYRNYPHFSNGKNIKFGLFVAPDLKTAQKFGSNILKFKTLGKNLIYRFPAEMKKHQQGYYKELYPKSFRPIVSNDLLDKGVEPQALFVGFVSPRAIEKIYCYDYSSYKWNEKQPEIFIEEYKLKNPKTKIYKSLFEPQEYNISLEDFVKRLSKEHNRSEEEILKILINVYKNSGYLHGIGNVPPTLLKNIENKLRKFIYGGVKP